MNRARMERTLAARRRSFRSDAEGVPRSGIEERTLPDGRWERRYYGRDVAAARDELREASWRSLNEQHQERRALVRMQGGRVEEHREADILRYERMGKVTAMRDTRVPGAPWGAARGGCDRCGATHGGLRYVPGSGWLCRKRCLREEEAVGCLAAD